MKTVILILVMVLSSVSALAEIRWQVTNDNKGHRVAKIRGFTIQQQLLYLRTEDSMYTLSNAVIQKAGFSMKELLDLLNEYDASKNKVLYFNATKPDEWTFTVDSIGAIVTNHKP